MVFRAGPGLARIQTTSSSHTVKPPRPRLLRRFVVLQRRERRRGRRIQPRFRLAQIGVTSLGGLCTLGLLALLSVWSGQVLIVAPLGASSVLLFGYPRSPFAQPRNVVLGNALGGHRRWTGRSTWAGSAGAGAGCGSGNPAGQAAALPSSTSRRHGLSGGLARGALALPSVPGAQWLPAPGAHGLGLQSAGARSHALPLSLAVRTGRPLGHYWGWRISQPSISSEAAVIQLPATLKAMLRQRGWGGASDWHRRVFTTAMATVSPSRAASAPG